MIGYNSKNNAFGTLLNPISAIGTTLILNSNEGDRFPSATPYLLTLEKVVSNVVTAREIVKVTNKSGDTFTIVRSSGTCLPNDTSTTQGTTAFDFVAGDSVSLYIISEIVEDLYTGISEKISKSGDTMTGVLKLAQGTNIASAGTTNLANATGNSVHITGTTTITSFGTVTAGTIFNLIFDGILTITYNATSLILPKSENLITQAGDVGIFESMGSGNWKCLSFQRANGQAIDTSTDINSLTEDTTGDMDNDYLVKYNTTNKKIKVNTYRASDAEVLIGTSTTKFVTPNQVGKSIISTVTTMNSSQSGTGTNTSSTYTPTTNQLAIFTTTRRGTSGYPSTVTIQYYNGSTWINIYSRADTSGAESTDSITIPLINGVGYRSVSSCLYPTGTSASVTMNYLIKM